MYRSRFAALVGYWSERLAVRATWLALVVPASMVASDGLANVPERGLERYVSTDSGIIAWNRSERDIYWLDNERVIFIGSKPGEMRVEKGHEFPKYALFAWNTVTGEIRRVAELSTRSELCAAPDGYVRYDFERNGVVYVRFGTFGHTHEIEADLQAMKDGILAVSPISCREYNPKLLKKRYGNWALPLLRPGEYLDRTSRDYREPMRYFPEDGSAPIPIPEIPNRDVVSTPRYSEFLTAYVFDEIRRRTGAQITERAWLLHRSGKVEESFLPAGPWMAGSVHAMPGRGGWILSSHAVDLKGGFGAAGIYLVKKGNSVTRLIVGYPRAFSVSPDGCRVATSIETRPRQETTRPTVRMINLCP